MTEYLTYDAHLARIDDLRREAELRRAASPAADDAASSRRLRARTDGEPVPRGRWLRRRWASRTA